MEDLKKWPRRSLARNIFHHRSNVIGGICAAWNMSRSALSLSQENRPKVNLKMWKCETKHYRNISCNVKLLVSNGVLFQIHSTSSKSGDLNETKEKLRRKWICMSRKQLKTSASHTSRKQSPCLKYKISHSRIGNTKKQWKYPWTTLAKTIVSVTGTNKHYSRFS